MTTATGTLVVELQRDSWVLRDHLPFEIRNEKYVLVARAQPERPIELAEGLYAVSLVLDTGERITRPAVVRRGQPTKVSLVAPDRGTGRVCALIAPTEGTTPSELRAVFRRPNSVAPAPEPCWIADASTNLAVLHDPEQRLIGVRLTSPCTSPAWVVVATERAALHLALPLSDHNECRDCTIELHRPHATGRVRVSVALPARRSGRALFGLMDTGKIDLALSVARAACEGLAREHADPVCAVYGALVLERCEPLAQSPPWFEHLATDCAWLPDGKILQAALLSRSEASGERQRGHDLLLEATRIPNMVFADSFSLAIKLLRRWPADDPGSEPRRARLAALAGISARFDFEHTFASVGWTRGELETLVDGDSDVAGLPRPHRDPNASARARWPSATPMPHEAWPLAIEVVAPELDAEVEATRRGSTAVHAAVLPPQLTAAEEARLRHDLVEAYEQGMGAIGP